MYDILSKSTRALCLKCGLECEVRYTSLLAKWRRKVKYCPYCGHPFDKSVPGEESMWEQEVE